MGHSRSAPHGGYGTAKTPPLQVTEAILGHTAGSRARVIGIYQRHDYADEKRAALDAWGAHVAGLVA